MGRPGTIASLFRRESALVSAQNWEDMCHGVAWLVSYGFEPKASAPMRGPAVSSVAGFAAPGCRCMTQTLVVVVDDAAYCDSGHSGATPKGWRFRQAGIFLPCSLR